MHISCMAYIGLEIKHKELIGLELVDVAEQKATGTLFAPTSEMV